MDKEDVVHTYNGYYSATKRNEIMPFEAICVDLEIIILSKVRKRKTNTLHVESERQHK